MNSNQVYAVTINYRAAAYDRCDDLLLYNWQISLVDGNSR
jgi:hypothetical protein